MIGPFKEVEAGGQISAAELNRLFQEVVRLGRMQAAPPLAITSDWQGLKIRIDMAPAMHVRITGQATSGSVGSGSGAPGYFYSGIEQWSYLDGTVQDAPTGIHFFTNLTPLVEMAMNQAVPVNAIVLATRAASGDHWEFLWGEAGSGGGGSGGGGDCTKCCCCCIPCKGPIWFYWPGQPGPDPAGFGVDYPTECFNRQCADRPDPLSPCGPIFMPAMMLQPEFDPDTIGDTYPRCWSCSGESPWIVGLAKVGDVSYGTINLSIKVCCDGPKHCPILTIRGTYTVNAIGASNMNVAEGTYEMCIGPVASDPSLTFNCHQRNNDDPSGPQDWQAGWLSTTLNDCDDTNFFGCPCHTQFGGDVTIRCGINTCERTGIPQSGFPVRMSDTGILYCGNVAIGYPGITGFMTPHVGFFPAPFVSNAPCGLYWTGQVTTNPTVSSDSCPDSSGCIIDILLMLLEDGSFALQLLSDSGSGTTCGGLVNGILSGDFFTAPSFAVTCNPFCMTITWSSAAHMYFGDCAAPFTPLDLSPAAWFDPGAVYKDTAGTTPATAEGDPIRLAIRPNDSSTSPTHRYATESTNFPTLHIDGNGRKWFKGGTSKKLTLSSSIAQTFATDFYFATVINRAAASMVNPWSGSTGNVGQIYSDNNAYLAPDGAGTFVSTAYTGATGDALIVFSNEGGNVYMQASGMAKILMGTLSTVFTNTVTELLARSALGQYTDATNYIGPQVFLQRTPTADEKAALCGVGGWFDLTYGVHL